MKTIIKKDSFPCGVVRETDNLGRIVIPIEFRKTFNWNEHQKFEMIAYEDGTILIKKYEISEKQ